MANLTPNSSFSLTMRLQLPNRTGMLAQVTQAIASVGGSLGQIDLISQERTSIIRDVTVDAASCEHAHQITQAVKNLPEIKVINIYDRTFNMHRGGKIRIENKIPLNTQADLAMAYTPGVGRICLEIKENPEQVNNLTIKHNTVAIVTDGSAVLGLGNLGPEAALPVMEGKAMLFKAFAGIDAFPICLDTQDPEQIVQTVKNIVPVFGGINLEDISAPRCFEIEARLSQELNIPVFHDDQHGTAIVSLAALINALKVVNKSIDEVRIVMNGAGAAGLSVARMLQTYGAKQIIICDSKGIISRDRPNLTQEKREFALEKGGSLADALVGADVFIGLSVPEVLTPEMVATMAKDPIIFAMANPIPEIQPELVADKVAVIATGRSDYPNQINNVLAFPGIFRGALDCRATRITDSMYFRAAEAIAALISPSELDAEHIIPSVFDRRVVPAVSAAVQQAARQEGIARA